MNKKHSNVTNGARQIEINGLFNYAYGIVNEARKYQGWLFDYHSHQHIPAWHFRHVKEIEAGNFLPLFSPFKVLRYKKGS